MPRIRDAANLLPHTQRPSAYSVEGVEVNESNKLYVSIDFDTEVTVDDAEKLVRLLHEEAGAPPLEARLWAPGDDFQMLRTIRL